MARRRAKPRRRTQKRGFNLVNAAEMYLSTAVLTQNFAGTNPLTFLTGIEYTQTGFNPAQPGQRPTAKFGYMYVPGANSVTLPEMLGVGASATLGQGTDVIRQNFEQNWVNAAMQSIGVKVGFTVGKKLLSKQRSFINNKILKPLNLKSTVVV